MSKALVFADDKNENQEMIFHINGDDRLFIRTGLLKDEHFNGFITLDKQDVKDFIAELTAIEKEMK